MSQKDDVEELKTKIRKLETVILSKNYEIEQIKAEHQLTGFAHAFQGYGIISLVESMGLKAEEWTELRERVIGFLPGELVEEIEKHFAGEV